MLSHWESSRLGEAQAGPSPVWNCQSPLSGTVALPRPSMVRGFCARGTVAWEKRDAKRSDTRIAVALARNTCPRGDVCMIKPSPQAFPVNCQFFDGGPIFG